MAELMAAEVDEVAGAKGKHDPVGSRPDMASSLARSPSAVGA